MLGWKEFEMEVVRDKADNCIIVCSIENIDPMGVHTGDSITIAPALTLTDKEYQIMRDASLAVLREIGVETGGSNVQFAVNPADGRMIVIEMNPRVSRSSALASKATGFPIAKVAAKLAVGFTLDEITNDITGGATPASFEPSIDYVVTKIPRFAFEKFPGAEPILTTAMKSVGEAMAIGRTFAESCKRLCARSTPAWMVSTRSRSKGSGIGDDRNAIRAALGGRRPTGFLRSLRRCGGHEPEEIYEVSHRPLVHRAAAEIIDLKAGAHHGLPTDAGNFARSRRRVFPMRGWRRLAASLRPTSPRPARRLGVHRYSSVSTPARPNSPRRRPICIRPMRRPLPGPVCEADPSARDKIVILGGGPNRIGQGIEFDYCCCHACFALSEAGYETIMINCNPETVSTDYDTSDRLYFEPLTTEDVLEILARARAGEAQRRHRAVRRSDPAQTRPCARIGGHPDFRDLARFDRSCRGSRPLQAPPR